MVKSQSSVKFGNQICIPLIKRRCLDCSKRFELLNSRAGRAGVVHNFMRGVSLQQTFPLSPFTPEDSGVNRVSGKISSTKIYSYLPAFIVDLGFIMFLFLDITITMKKCNHPVFISDKPVLFLDDFDGLLELHPTNIKRLYMVDAGLTFNSPYPLVLRPQRAVEIILSFDFSARPSDTTPPFKVTPLPPLYWRQVPEVKNYLIQLAFNFYF